jgi:hypothetical protein
MGQFSVEKPLAPGSVLSGNQHSIGAKPPISRLGLTQDNVLRLHS